MATEVPRCSDCGTALKSVPTWLANAKVSFTCSACPRRSTRGAAATARLDRPAETSARLTSDDPDLEVDEIEELDEDADLDLGAEELDDVKEDADL